MDIEVAEAAAVPVFVRVMLFGDDPVLHVGVAELLPNDRVSPTRAMPVTWTSAELDEEPKIPNTKPPIATAAIKVTAMISTVAMIGEMAFLCLVDFILELPASRQ